MAFLNNFKRQVLLLVIIGCVFYTNTLYNEYALDDGIVIQKNEYVQQGFRGIPKIMSTDAYDSFYKQMNARQQLSGGRYRPLSVVTFAVEQQFFGTKKIAQITENTGSVSDNEKTLASVRHLLNVVFYILSVVLLLYFLRNYIFTEAPAVAFIASLIFLIHPLHTEVVANIKSRDEILSFLFIILTLLLALQYKQTSQKKYLLVGVLSYFLALLSKEYAITLLLLLPMLLYIVKKFSIKESLLATIPYFAVAAVYLYIRFSIVGKGGAIANPDVLNDPFKYATSTEALATKIELLNHYLKLLFYPHPLSSDYSYNTIPYLNFSDIRVWFAVSVHLGLVAAVFVLFFKRNILSFAIAFYLLHVFLVSNLVMDLGATMGERLIYHSSFGFSIAVAVMLYALYNKLKISLPIKQSIAAVAVLAVTTASAVIVIKRNADWKSDTTLFIADAQTVPNSALVNGNAGKAYIDLSEKPENKAQETELLKKAIYHLHRAVTIHKEYVNGYLNIGVAYFKLKQYDKALECWETAKRIYPNNPFLKRNIKLMASVYYNDAMKIGREQPQEARKLIEKATELDPANADYWYNLGGVNYTMGDFTAAQKAWVKTLQLHPNHQDAKRGMAALPQNLK